MIIKASNITNLTDARYFAAKEATFLCYNLEEGATAYLDPMYMKAIREWVEGPKTVGVFRRTPLRVVSEAAAFYALDALELSASFYGDALEDVSDWPLIIDLDLPLSEVSGYLARMQGKVAYFQLSVSPENRADCQAFLPDWCASYPLILDMHFPSEILIQQVQALQPAGINLSGGEEEMVGVKSFDEVEAVFEGLGW